MNAASVAGYKLTATSSNTSFTGNWGFLLGGVSLKDNFPNIFPQGSSESLNTFSYFKKQEIKLYTSRFAPDNEGSFSGIVVFLSVATGRGGAVEAFIAGSGFGEIARTSSTPFTALSGLVGLSIYSPFG